jgi:hypothetical protein
MIGSHGRDRAEASGELTPPPQRISSPALEAQRELITILPRRITRELPVVVSPEVGAEAGPAAPAPAAPAADPPAAAAEDPALPHDSPIEPPPAPIARPSPPPPPRAPVEAGVRRVTTGVAPKVFFMIAALLTAATVLMWCHKQSSRSGAPGQQDYANESGEAYDAALDTSRQGAFAPPADAAVAVVAHADAAVAVVAHADAAVAMVAHADAAVAMVAHADAAVAMVAHADAAVEAPPVDARGSRRDNAVIARADAGPAVSSPGDRVKLATELLDRAQAAIDDGDPETALALADRSLQLRPAIRGYLERARALQHLDRVDSALSSIDEALARDGKYAPSWELRGRILWAVRRYDEARAAFEKFLELDPSNKSAPSIKHLLEEPR